jgi:hypothetical protein
MGTLGAYMPVKPLGASDLGSIALPGLLRTGSEPRPPEPLYGLASGRVARLELRTEDGLVIMGSLYPIRSDAVDAEQAFLFLLPADRPLGGTLVAYDAAGDELQREPVRSVG